MELYDDFPFDYARTLFPEARGYRVRLDPDFRSVFCRILQSGYRVAQLHLTYMPGNSSLLILHDMRVRKEHRGRGHGHNLHRLVINWATCVRAVRLVCTVRESNLVQKHLLRATGWTRASVLVNPRTLREIGNWEYTFPIVTTLNRLAP